MHAKSRSELCSATGIDRVQFPAARHKPKNGMYFPFFGFIDSGSGIERGRGDGETTCFPKAEERSVLEPLGSKKFCEYRIL